MLVVFLNPLGQVLLRWASFLLRFRKIPLSEECLACVRLGRIHVEHLFCELYKGILCKIYLYNKVIGGNLKLAV